MSVLCGRRTTAVQPGCGARRMQRGFRRGLPGQGSYRDPTRLPLRSGSAPEIGHGRLDVAVSIMMLYSC